jgi:hypothetical protein
MALVLDDEDTAYDGIIESSLPTRATMRSRFDGSAGPGKAAGDFADPRLVRIGGCRNGSSQHELIVERAP